MRSIAGKIQKWLSRSRLAVFVAAKVMNQCRLIIGLHFTPSCEASENGEQAVIDGLAPRIASFFDVGANAGHWTESLLRAQGSRADVRGLLLEPNETLARDLRSTFASDPRMAVDQCAVSSEAGTATFYLSKTCSEHSSLVVENAGAAVATNVRVETVDRLMSIHGFHRLDFLKIDVEGSDFDVLLGAKSALSSGAIRCVQFEYGSSWKLSGHTLCAAVRFLESYGYACYLITPRGLCPYDFRMYGELFVYANFVAFDKTCVSWAEGMRREACG